MGRMRGDEYTFIVIFKESIEDRHYYCLAHDWCRWNIKDFKAAYGGDQADSEFYFKNADDAIQFKLIWG